MFIIIFAVNEAASAEPVRGTIIYNYQVNMALCKLLILIASKL